MELSPKKGALIYVAVVGGALAWILYQTGVGTLAADQFSAEAVVEAVKVVDATVTPPRKEAIVRLTGGESVAAAVPPACVVFPGQTVTVSHWRAMWGRGQYTVLSVKETQ